MPTFRILVLLAPCFLMAANSLAATLTVTSTDDDGPGTLREAIATASPGDVIEFAVTGVISLTSGQLTIDKDLTIGGPGAELLRIHGSCDPDPGFRVFRISSGAAAKIDAVTIAEGCLWDGIGAGILNEGVLALADVALEDNYSEDGGGAFYNLGTMALSDSHVDRNRSGSGAAFLNEGTLFVRSSHFSRNGEDPSLGAGPRSMINVGNLVIFDSSIVNDCCRIWNEGDATFLRTSVLGIMAENPAEVRNTGTLAMWDSEIVDFSGIGTGALVNEAGGFARFVRSTARELYGGYVIGGIRNAGVMEIRNATVSDNFGGETAGISNSGTLSIVNTTISSNENALGDVAGVANSGLLELTNVTVSHNFCTDGPCVGFRNTSTGSVELRNTILANPLDGTNCDNSGTLVSLGYNIDSDGSCGLAGPGDIISDPLLGPLADNGGLTLTHGPLPGSPAIDAVPLSRCVYDDDDDADTPEVPLSEDQRGVPRPLDGDGDDIALCDIGAVEFGLLAEIDIRPWSKYNLIYPFSQRLIPVALLGSDDFDVSAADATTLALGPDGASPVSSILEDVNEDGLMDLLSDYSTDETGIALGDEEACVTGEMLDGAPFKGCDAVRIACDVDDNQEVDVNDIDAIFAARGSEAFGPDDPRDANADGIITVNDGRICVLECTNSACAESFPQGAGGEQPPACGLLGIEPLMLVGLPLWARRRRTAIDT